MPPLRCRRILRPSATTKTSDWTEGLNVAEQPIEPIHQFRITNLFDIGTFGGNGTDGSGTHLAFTNSALFMVLTVGLIMIFLIVGSNRRAIVPGRLQLMTEMSYEFIANMVRNTANTENKKNNPQKNTQNKNNQKTNQNSKNPYFFT